MKYVIGCLLGFIFAVGYTVEAKADGVSFDKSTFTHHFDYADWMNEDNDLYYVQYNKGRILFSAGTFKNTWSERSIFMGTGYRVVDYKYLEVDLIVGGTTGYTQHQIKTICLGGVCLWGAPRVTIKHEIFKDVEVRMSVQQLGTAFTHTLGIGYTF